MTPCERSFLSVIVDFGPLDQSEIDETEEASESSLREMREALASLRAGSLISRDASGRYASTSKGREELASSYRQ